MTPRIPPNIAWPFPFPVPTRLIGPLSLTPQDLQVIQEAGKDVERAYERFRQRVGQLSKRYGVGREVFEIVAISDAVLHNARHTALAKGLWP